jgi:hypothetical protein
MLPQLRRIHEHLPGVVQIIGVHSAKFAAERDPDNLRAAVARLGVDHPVVADPEMRVWSQFAIRAWPTVVFVDPTGRVIGQHAGEFDLEPVLNLLAEILTAHGLASPPPLPPAPETPVPAMETTLRFPTNVLADPARHQIIIADGGHHQLVVAGLDGSLRARVGDGVSGLRDGDAATARFATPQGLVLGPDGDALFVSDTGNHSVRRVDLATLAVTTIAGTGRLGTSRTIGPPRQTSLRSPWGLAWADGELWIAMAGSHQLWAWDPGRDALRVAAGSGAEAIQGGPLATATFAQSSGLASANRIIYSADPESSSVRAVDRQADRVRRLVGRGLFEFGDRDGRGDTVLLQHDEGIAAGRSESGAMLYVADTYNDKIKQLDPETRETVTLAGSTSGYRDGRALDAQFWEPMGLAALDDALLIADTNNHAIRQLSLTDNDVTTLILKRAPN